MNQKALQFQQLLLKIFSQSPKYEIDISGNLTSQKTEPIAADARENRDGKKNALIKLIAGLLGVGFDQLSSDYKESKNL